jgi:hypothetical protein
LDENGVDEGAPNEDPDELNVVEAAGPKDDVPNPVCDVPNPVSDMPAPPG